MKIVINDCYGGFGLSPLGIKKFAELNGKECYFFLSPIGSNEYHPITVEQAAKQLMWHAYSVPNPQDYEMHKRDEDGTFKEANKRAEKISLDSKDIKRNDENLVKVVQILGDKADGLCAKLKVIEIPDDVEWYIEEYDGFEHVAENHRTWN